MRNRRNVRKDTPRRRAFRIALMHAGMTVKGWAAEHGVSETHLHLVLAEKRPSDRLMREIDEFIRAANGAAA